MSGFRISPVQEKCLNMLRFGNRSEYDLRRWYFGRPTINFLLRKGLAADRGEVYGITPNGLRALANIMENEQ